MYAREVFVNAVALKSVEVVIEIHGCLHCSDCVLTLVVSFHFIPEEVTQPYNVVALNCLGHPQVVCTDTRIVNRLVHWSISVQCIHITHSQSAFHIHTFTTLTSTR